MLQRYINRNQLRFDPEVAHIMLQATQKAMKHLAARVAYLSMSESLILLNTRHSMTNAWLECEAASTFCSIYSGIVNSTIKSGVDIPFLFNCRMIKCNNEGVVHRMLKSIEGNTWSQTKKQNLSDEEIEKLPRIYTRGISILYNHELHEFETYLSQSPKHVFDKELV